MKKTNSQLQAEVEDLQRIIETQQATVTQAGEREREATAYAKSIERKAQAEFEQVKGETDKLLEAEKKAHNLTRDVLHSTELELARIRGYLDGQKDSQPPRMVPEDRENRLSSYHDGSRSLPSTSGGWQSSTKPWYHQ